MTRPKYLFELDGDKFVLRSEGEGSAVLQQAPPRGGEGEDSHIYLNRDRAILLRAALGEWLKAGQPPVADDKEKQVLLMEAKLEGPPGRLLVFGMSQAAWDHCKDGETHTFDLTRFGLSAWVIITGGETQESIVDNLNAGANLAGADFEDQRKRVPTTGIPTPTKQ
jgi:hypothetical protein